MPKFDRRSKNEKNSKLYNVVVAIMIRKSKKKSQRHIFIIVIIQIKQESIFVRTMMNSDATKNFMSQLKIQKLNFLFFVEINAKLCTMNDISLQIYEKHDFDISVTNIIKKMSTKIQKIIEINIKKIDIILKLF